MTEIPSDSMPDPMNRTTQTLPDRLIGLDRGQKRLLQVLTDMVLIVFSFVAAMALRLDNVFFLHDGRIWAVLAVVVPVSLAVFIRLGFYRAITRYITSRAYTIILMGILASTATMLAATWAFAAPVPRSVPVIYALLTFVLIGGLRVFMRRLLSAPRARERVRVVIYGAGASGRQLQLSLLNGAEYLPVAFVDDAKDLQGRNIDGCPVYAPATLPDVIRKHNAARLLLAMPRLSRGERAAILRSLDQLPVQVQTIPGSADLVSGRTKISDIVDISVEDLLGRDPAQPRDDLMHHDIAGRVVMVTGAGGSIGSELCRQIVAQGPKQLILFEMSEYNLYAIDQELQTLVQQGSDPVVITPLIGSVQDKLRVAAVLGAYGVETIYHAAAYKHVPLVEANVVEGISNNVFGTRTLAEAAVAAGVRAFILISTDKAVRPTNVMGASKRLAELVCQAMAQQGGPTRFSMVRFGNVLGSSGSVLPLFRQQIAGGGPVTVTHPDITRYFMTIPEAAQLVIQAGAMSKGGDVFILDMGIPVRIVDLAVRMAQLSGLQPVVIPPGSTAEAGASGGDIEIRFTGLRPGEKLYEELLIDADSQPTSHPRIFTATEGALAPDVLSSLLVRLQAHCATNDEAAIRDLLSGAQAIGYGLAEVPDIRVA
ncbi:MAG: polysaccharide biosynthesis protein [Rhodobacteraceae bacterium]|nr:polysaccharide biosynthesis protein [Paracoccaceae bacterium]